jgi:hypothetical protein
MPLSPNAPDYVGQVRGILDDLRGDYLKRQQLFQQEQQVAAQNSLGYAQLGAQQQTSARQAALDGQRIEAANINSQRELAQLNAQIGQKQIDNELAYGKFNLDRQKEEQKLQAERDAQEQDKTAAALEQKYRLAMLKGNPDEVNNVLNEIGQSNVDRAQRLSITQNVHAGLEATRKLEEADRNMRTATPARAVASSIQSLNPQDLTPDQFMSKIEQYDNQFRDFNNTDPRVNDDYSKARAFAMEKMQKYRSSVIGQQIDDFIDKGEQGIALAEGESQLGPKYQKAYNDLKNSGKLTNKAVQGLVFNRNQTKTIEDLKTIDNRLSSIAQNLINQNPGLAVVQNDKITGEPYRTFTYPIPDLSPSVGYNNNIDPETGLMTKAAQDKAKKWEDEFTSPNFLYGQVPIFRQFQTQQANVPQMPATGTPATKQGKPVAQTAPLPFRSGSRFDIGQPGTVVIPTAPKTQQAQISPATIAIVVEAYRKDPNAVVYGRKASEILATLKAQGVELPNMIVTPGDQETGSGQNR